MTTPQYSSVCVCVCVCVHACVCMYMRVHVTTYHKILLMLLKTLRKSVSDGWGRARDTKLVKLSMSS